MPTLRSLLDEQSTLVVVECHNVLSARIVAARGYRATYLGGSTVAALNAGLPDHGLVSTREILDQAAHITGAVDIPLIVDADQGGETILNVHRCVRDFEHAGIAAIHLEDTTNPKHLFTDDDQLVPLDVMRARIGTAVAARRSDEFLIIARTDERVNRGGIDETIRRGQAFAEEGADVFMAPALGRLADLRAVIEAVPIPVLDINVPVERAREAGLAIDLFAGISLPGLMRAQHELIDGIERCGRVGRDAYAEPEGFPDLVGDAIYRRLAKRWQTLEH
ncbi:carboxyvinyl-carboxyphosphonate phosphorylmutase [Mycobacterium paraintracellulare]|uniref:isocitrate lyase/PEP mutase family protein n=1 Tax=Mycobacterium paraintracellulare TaxID=1138383 RepID=UPI0019259C0B|nr:isocitrate lyase/PEP mutase family protein [Mycobacterium paraintracellulare]BCO39235.1 carboxyvinyl-carboxyphosphonate phosphorylmutase [Mycobacterium paraintracellulare]